MPRILFFTRRRFLGLAQIAIGATLTGVGGFWFWTRKCHFEEFGPHNDNLFRHPLLKQINPYNNPDSHDMCVRRVPFSQLRPELLEDALQGGSKLAEDFCRGIWGRYGYSIQRRIMESWKDDSNSGDLWTKEELLASTYEPGTFITNHFHVLEKTPQSLTIRGCVPPHQTTPTPMSMENLVEIRADLDREKQEAVFRLKMMTFDGTQGASQEPDPFGGFPGWLHRRYSTLLVEAAAENCMR
ncbi:hypothetical protein B0J13DRAFT_485343 [Dactylonectria estremocensis]|uniref:Uncharacterized protein n=1 Tax=Dactylonectria estremocensis TaxID=1079267 RepID=A0A9P9DMB7_9HYPO|nr:hypothetical protein B0J13DRAFT_485343 [Dactylonectria estremocensis]